MRDPLTWSFPIGRFFGITVRVHLLFLFFTIGMVARGLTAEKSYALEALIIQAILFFSVLLHEFGHCFAARQVDGDASEILMWPLGGLAFVDVPNTARANLITVLGGPMVNLMLCIASASALAVYGLVPPINPLWDPIFAEPSLLTWVSTASTELNPVSRFFAQLFSINWLLFWFNVLLVGFPLDGGRILQCLLWPHVGYRRATLAAIFCGWVVALLLALSVVVFFKASDGANLLMLFFLALFIYATCKQEFMLLEGRMNDESVFGYDFSQGYTSLEREQAAPPKRRRPNFWQRWLQRRAERRRQRDEEERVREEARLDELLAKVRANGTQSLTEEEKRFLNRVSAKFRNRNQS